MAYTPTPVRRDYFLSKCLLLVLIITIAPLLLYKLNKGMVPARNASKNAGDAAGPSAAKPPYYVGLGYVTANRSMGSEKAWAKVAEAAHVAYIQRTWAEWDSEEFEKDIQEARRNGLRLYLALEVLNTNRKSLRLPKSLKGDFRSPALREQYLGLVTDTARKYKPDYFVVNVEADLYQPHNPKDYEAFVRFYPEVYRAVKEASSGTQTAVSVCYLDRNGKDGIDAEDKVAFRKRVADFDADSDLLAVSIYPLSCRTPSAIPESLLHDIGAPSSHPLFVAETGWPSRSFDIRAGSIRVRFKTSQLVQADYIERLHACADYAMGHGKQIEAINYVSLVDVGWVARKVLQMAMPQFEWFGSLALLESSEREKEAFARMKQWKKDLSAPRLKDEKGM